MCDSNPAPVTIARFSDGEIIYANQRMAELVGRPPETLVGRKTTEFYENVADREIVRGILQRQQLLQDYELPLRHPDGRLLWVNVSMRMLELSGTQCVLGIMLDVTERRSYAERLKSERRLLRRLLELNERDRQLIAYEIHDGFVQDVTGAILHLQASVRRIGPDDAAQKDLNKGIEILRGAIDEARRLIDGLQPGVLEEQGVVEGIRYLAQQTERMHEIEVELDIDVSFDRLAPAVEQAIYRIVQEGLNNVVKHSKSPRARVVLSQRVDALVIKVEDWGVGFNTLTTKSRRYGLTGIRDRARLLGGKAKIRSEPGQGTRLRVKLPLNDALLPEGWKQVELTDEDSTSGMVAPSDDSDV
jgi:PAS domain S-box-containing protein